MSNGSQTKVSQFSRRAACYSNEECAVEELNLCDYSLKISLDDALAGTAPRKVRVYADGVYDMFHSGHARQFMQIHARIPNAYLIVGVCNDEQTLKHKGKTVFTQDERYEALRHCRYVDEVLTDAPWSYDFKFLEEKKIDFVAHDDIPYETEDSDDIYKFVKERGMFFATQRTEGISTTDVITRIIRDYDMYLKRNLSRGMNAKDLNISPLYATKLRVEERVASMKRTGSNSVRQLGNQLSDFQRTFVRMFSRDGGSQREANGKRAAGRGSVLVSHDELSSDTGPSSPEAEQNEAHSPPPKKFAGFIRSRLSKSSFDEVPQVNEKASLGSKRTRSQV